MASHDIGTIGTIEVQLAAWLPPEDRYQRRLVPVKPSSRVIPGSPDSVAPDTTIAEWRITDFSGGSGNELWEEGSGRFHKAYAMQFNPVGAGAILGNEISTMADRGATDMTAIERIVMAGGYVGAGTDDKVYSYPDVSDPTSGEFDLGANTSGTSSDITNMAAWNDGVDWIASGHENKQIRLVPSSTVHYNTGTADDFTYHPVLCNYFGNVYALDGNDLYLIGAADTRTIKAQPESTNKYESAQYLSTSTAATTEPWRYNRLTTSDIGPVWWVRNDNGKVYLYEYNVADNAGGFIGTLPGTVYPYDMVFDRGFYFVSYRNTFLHANEGLPYVYFQNRAGTTRGVIGPLLNPSHGVTTSYASQPVVLPGIYGDRLLAYCKNVLFGYDLTSGGITPVAYPVSTDAGGGPTQAVIYGNEVLIARAYPSGVTKSVEKIDLNKYTETSGVGSIYTGSYDYGYPGVDKVILDVTIELQDGVRGTQSVDVYYKLDAGAAVLVGSMDNGSSNAVQTFTVSSSTTTVVAKRIEWVVEMSVTDGDYTPQLISISSRAGGAASRYEWVVQVDCSTIPNGDQAGWEIIDQLQTLRTNKTVVSFTDPWQQEGTNSPDTFDVTVEEVYSPLYQPDGNLTAQVRLRGVAMV